ncbi:MAG: multidrug ABC transporter substrate-binding protein [Candidatus Solibacter sp.]|nr:multidrug ABC transporter substrate-binding protein [Candidatus Solibacter sp.]
MSRAKQNWLLIAAGIGLAMDAIRGHKTRSFLTVLGVIIGTGTIIGVGSILTGFDGAVTSAIQGFGADSIIVFKWQAGISFGRRPAEERRRKPLTYENAVAIRERCPSVAVVSPYLFPSQGFHRARYKGNESLQLDFGGTDPSYAEGGQADMMAGRFFTEFENHHRSPVAVIGEDLYKTLFASGDVIGKDIDVDGHSFQVVGVMRRPANSFPGSQDNRLILPYWTMRKFQPGAKEHMLVVVAQPGKLPVALDEVRGVLRTERRLKYSDPDNFGLSTAEQMIEDFRQVTSVTALVMVVLSSIGLLVGGIGVMNIMLVSVTERTKEIGIRKAIGARRADIVIQFLTEAVVLTFAGGLLGMALGYVISLISKAVFPSLPTSVPLWAAALGVIVSVGVGIFFGLWPATKAARLDPVDALRYE